MTIKKDRRTTHDESLLINFLVVLVVKLGGDSSEKEDRHSLICAILYREQLVQRELQRKMNSVFFLCFH